MDFKGSGQALTAQDYVEASHASGIGIAELRAVVQVEASGRGQFPDGRLKILFEPHVFYQQLGAGLARDTAVQQGLAYPKQGMKPYPTSPDARYRQLAEAMNIDITRALRSASWGLPQILGYNYAACGYGGVIDMIEDFKAGERQQLGAFLRLLKTWGIDDDLRDQRWVPFALRYNGPKAVERGYPDKLKKAYDAFKLSAAVAILATPSDGLPTMESWSDLPAAA